MGHMGLNSYTPTVEDHMGKKKANKGKEKAGPSKRRKRVINKEDIALIIGFPDAIHGLNATLFEGNHFEPALAIYGAVMRCSHYDKSDLMTWLSYLMEHKATTIVFVEMSLEDKELWINTHLDKVRSVLVKHIRERTRTASRNAIYSRNS